MNEVASWQLVCTFCGYVWNKRKEAGAKKCPRCERARIRKPRDVQPKVSDADYFWSKVAVGAPNECWLWLAGTDSSGYGRLPPRLGVLAGSAHKFSYQLAKGAVPAGLEIDHLCRNRPCVNPGHLEAVTHLENMRRSHRTHCRFGHLLDEANTYTFISKRNGYPVRRCRTCLRDPNRPKLWTRKKTK